MTASALWRRAALASDPKERSRAIDEGCRPEVVQELLDEARSLITTAPEDALRCVGIAGEVADRLAIPRVRADAARARGQVLRALSRHSEAIDCLEAASRLAAEAGDHRAAAQYRVGIVDSLGWLERFDEALALADTLEAELLDLGEPLDAGRVRANAGNLHHRRDDYKPALRCYDSALDRLAGVAEPEVIARVEANKANILTHLNKVEDAMALYEKARRTFDERGDALSAAVVDLNVGFLRYISGEHSASLSAFTRSRRAFEAAGRKLEAAKVDGDMGDVYRALNLLPEALECYDRAIDVFAEVGLQYETARAEIGRAVVLAGFGRSAEATAALNRADAIFRDQKNRLQRAHVSLIRAHVLRAAGKDAQAARAAASAAKELTRAALHGWAAEALYIQADAELEQGHDATRSMLNVIEAARGSGRGSLESRAHHALGRYYRSKGDTEQALEHLRAGVEALERARTLVTIEEFHVAFLRDKLTIYEDLVATLLTRGLRADVIEALDCVERSKSRLLLERVQTAHDARLRAGAVADADLVERLGRLRAELCRHYHSIHVFDGAEQLQRRVGVTVGGSAVLQQLETEYRSALREAELVAPRNAERRHDLASVVSAADLQAALDPDEALVEYTSFFGQVCAFVLTRNDITVRLNLAQVDEVNHAARRLRFHLQRIEGQRGYVERHLDEFHATIKGVLTELYRMLIKPIEGMLPGSKLVIVPHGVVHALPLHAAADGDSYALDRWEIVYAPGAAVWYAGTKSGRKLTDPTDEALSEASALLMAVPAPGIELVSEEVDQLATLFPRATVRRGPEATLEAFHQHAPGSRIIHLATHALFRADNPLFSGLSFADGWLLARDLYDIDLSCELATLSACRTGANLVEPGDELFGLTRGFLAAGARSLAVSLWPADDAATVAVMVRFYRNMAAGMSRGAALRTAQIESRAEYPHPYHWAAFALVGAR